MKCTVIFVAVGFGYQTTGIPTAANRGGSYFWCVVYSYYGNNNYKR